jgi:predicted dehydrogenase
MTQGSQGAPVAALNVWLVGAGTMSIDYLKVLRALEARTVVIGRGGESAEAFTRKTGVAAQPGGLNAFLAARPAPADCAIVAVGMEALGTTTRSLIEHGVRRILVEKPGALTGREIRDIDALASRHGAEVFIAYNRRTYASTLRALEIIQDDGGVRSMHFEFTEWAHVIRDLRKAPGVKEALVIGNSSHVIDLAFYLGGKPVEWQSYTEGALDWHPTSSVFAGAGRTDRGALFTYQADWDAPGRWGLEVMTRQSRLVLRPMEALQIMRKGSVALADVRLDDRLDKEFKPGLYEQVRRFMQGRVGGFCSLSEQVEAWGIYAQMAGYEDPPRDPASGP